MEGNNYNSPQNQHLENLGCFNTSGETGSNSLDEDGRLKRTGTVWTASAHITIAVIGSGVLSLAWAMAQLGLIAGLTVLLLFSFLTYYTCSFLSDCYRSGDPVNGTRNYTYMDAVQSIIGGMQVKIFGFIQYLNLFGVAMGYTIAASISMMAIKRSHCFHVSVGKSPCNMSSKPYMILFGIGQVIFSQIPGFELTSWLSIVAAVMSFTYSSIGLGLSISKFADNSKIGGSLTGGIVRMQIEDIWKTFQAIGDIAFAYSYSTVLIEIQDTVGSPPSEATTMKKATRISLVVTTLFYALCGFMGYAAFGESTPKNLLTGFGFYNPYWLLDIANVGVVTHLTVAYQVDCQPLFAWMEESASRTFPDCKLITEEIKVPIFPGYKPYNFNFFRLVSRTIFVIINTTISVILPFEDIAGLFVALRFWSLTVYYPLEMYIRQKNVTKWSTKWLAIQILNGICLIITIAAVAGSVVGVINHVKGHKLFPAFD